MSDTESTFNTQVPDVFDSLLNQTHAFVWRYLIKLINLKEHSTRYIYIMLKLNITLSGIGWYYHHMICYYVQNDIITLDNIKFVVKSSLSLPKNYKINSLIIVIKISKIIEKLLIIQWLKFQT